MFTYMKHFRLCTRYFLLVSSTGILFLHVDGPTRRTIPAIPTTSNKRYFAYHRVIGFQKEPGCFICQKPSNKQMLPGLTNYTNSIKFQMFQFSPFSWTWHGRPFLFETHHSSTGTWPKRTNVRSAWFQVALRALSCMEHRGACSGGMDSTMAVIMYV